MFTLFLQTSTSTIDRINFLPNFFCTISSSVISNNISQRNKRICVFAGCATKNSSTRITIFRGLARIGLFLLQPFCKVTLSTAFLSWIIYLLQLKSSGQFLGVGLISRSVPPTGQACPSKVSRVHYQSILLLNKSHFLLLLSSSVFVLVISFHSPILAVEILNTFLSLIFRGLGEKAGLVRKRIICWGRKTVFRPPGLHKTSLTVGAKNRDMS